MTDQQLLQYSRQIMLPQFDIGGQEKICAATVLIVGVGGLGCPVALYLAAAGVKRMLLVDNDTVDASNLQRQIAHDTTTVGMPKVESASIAIKRLAPNCELQLIAEQFSEKNATDLVACADIVLDCSDNFACRFLVNRHCVQQQKPLVSGAAIQMEGQVAVFDSRQPNSPCYRCLYDETGQEDVTCANNGVLGPVVGVIGSLQAIEALKLIADVRGTLTGRLLVMDALHMDWRTVTLKKDPGCLVCGG
ncbi:MAG: molybdopterin-synthase adenylyltransferase MoeB [Gammaproteobacteria bacterium]|nr:MAG: molybdopterin-synthase adenylyltransferase MoeB [Gammaproteobacteria bacterium]